jgi:hypothetical protein
VTLLVSFARTCRARWLCTAAAWAALASLAAACKRHRRPKFEISSNAPADQQVEPGQRGSFEVTVKNVGHEMAGFSVLPRLVPKRRRI